MFVLDPTQGAPSAVGAGLLQYRLLLRTPGPHDTEQDSQLPQVPQLPSTEK